jgi:hypothetical protein
MPDIQNTVTADAAVAAEKKRAIDLKAAFGKDPAFALEAIEAGWSVTEAKAERCDRLQKAAAATVHGDSGVPFGDGTPAIPPVNFIEQARELAQSKGISRTEAMRQIAAEQPKLYEDFLASESRRPVLSK